MPELKPCPQCGEVPKIGYACGEYFILPISRAVGACVCSYFAERHSTEVIGNIYDNPELLEGDGSA